MPVINDITLEPTDYVRTRCANGQNITMAASVPRYLPSDSYSAPAGGAAAAAADLGSELVSN